MSSIGAWIALPEKLEIAVSEDGSSFQTVAVIRRPLKDETSTMYIPYGAVLNERARFVRLRAFRADAPQHEWLFLDEVEIN